MSRPPIRTVVAFCGTRGVPANYGGFETAVDEISRRLVDGGVACDVFCRLSSSGAHEAVNDGRTLRYVRGSTRSVFDTFVSSIETGWQLLCDRERYGHVFWFNNANLPGILLTKIAGIPMSINTDGLEWRRAKWRLPFKAYYLAGSWLISRLGETLISDSRAIQDHYRRYFRKETTFIPYGIPVQLAVSPAREQEILDRWRLERGRYLLQITRVEPDNLPLEIAAAFRESELGRDRYAMVSIGYKDPTPYAQHLMKLDGRDGVRVHKAIYDREILQVLRAHCHAYVHGNSVGGTNPALLEAMATCPRVLAIDCEFSREVLADTGRFFDRAHLARDLRAMIDTPERGPEMQERIARHYQWDTVAAAYKELVESKLVQYIARDLVAS